MSLSITTLAHTHPHLLAAPQGPFGTDISGHHTATAQSIPLPALPQGCHPPAGAALPGWDPCVLRASSAAESWGWHRGVQHPQTRAEGRNWNCPFPAQTSCSTATRDPAPRGDHRDRGGPAQPQLPLLSHPCSWWNLPGMGNSKIQGERQEGNPRGIPHLIQGQTSL